MRVLILLDEGGWLFLRLFFGRVWLEFLKSLFVYIRVEIAGVRSLMLVLLSLLGLIPSEIAPASATASKLVLILVELILEELVHTIHHLVLTHVLELVTSAHLLLPSILIWNHPGLLLNSLVILEILSTIRPLIGLKPLPWRLILARLSLTGLKFVRCVVLSRSLVVILISPILIRLKGFWESLELLLLKVSLILMECSGLPVRLIEFLVLILRLIVLGVLLSWRRERRDSLDVGGTILLWRSRRSVRPPLHDLLKL